MPGRGPKAEGQRKDGKSDVSNKARNLPAVPSLGGEQSLNRYLSEIKKFPILKPEQEYMLAKRWRYPCWLAAEDRKARLTCKAHRPPRPLK